MNLSPKQARLRDCRFRKIWYFTRLACRWVGNAAVSRKPRTVRVWHSRFISCAWFECSVSICDAAMTLSVQNQNDEMFRSMDKAGRCQVSSALHCAFVQAPCTTLAYTRFFAGFLIFYWNMSIVSLMILIIFKVHRRSVRRMVQHHHEKVMK